MNWANDVVFRIAIAVVLYCVKKQPWECQCYVRHSWAYAPQNVLLSDIDLTCFVSINNFKSFQVARAEINTFFKKHWLLRWLPIDVDVVPDTPESRRRCDSYYVHRTLYPFRSWMKLGEKRHAVQERFVVPTLPLDYSVENTLECYIQPVIERTRTPHPLQPFLLARKVNRDRSAFGGESPTHKVLSLAKSLHEEVRFWDKFYHRLDFSDETWELEVEVPRQHQASSEGLQSQWRSQVPALDDWGVLKSVWAWPSYVGDQPIWHISINLDLQTSSSEMLSVYRSLSGYFKSMIPFCSLAIGSETSMVGRLNALSRNLLLDPWLFITLGICLYGEADCRKSIVFPSRSQFSRKYQEYLFYYCSTVLGGAETDYGFYQLGLAVDTLLRSGKLVMDPLVLQENYPKLYVEPDDFDGIDQSEATLSMLDELHNFSLWNTGRDTLSLT